MTKIREYHKKNMDDDGKATLVEDIHGNAELWIEKYNDKYMVVDQDMYNCINCELDRGDEDIQTVKEQWLDYIT